MSAVAQRFEHLDPVGGTVWGMLWVLEKVWPRQRKYITRMGR